MRFTLQVPASTANLGPGFDSLGLALGLYDRVTIANADSGAEGLEITVQGSGKGEIPLDERHLVYRSMQAAADFLGDSLPADLSVDCYNGIPQSRGLGSSAAAIVAGVAAGFQLLGHPVPANLPQINEVASSLEGHPDNASASVFGGFTVSWARGADFMSGWTTKVVTPDARVRPVALIPAARLATSTARAALPTEVAHKIAARNSGRAALLPLAISQAPELLLDATLDFLHQEARRPAYPQSMAVVDILRDAGVAAFVSGAGPTVLALLTKPHIKVESYLADNLLAGWHIRPLEIPLTGVQICGNDFSCV